VTTVFIPQPELDAEDVAARAWLVEALERLRAEKRLPAETRWHVELGRRETEAPGGRRLVQTGFRIRACAASEDASLPLSCFVPIDDLSDADREGTALVLSLWIDRLF
jgi:hypothetical protein